MPISLETAKRRVPNIIHAIKGTREALEAIKNSDMEQELKERQIKAHEAQIASYTMNLEEARRIIGEVA